MKKTKDTDAPAGLLARVAELRARARREDWHNPIRLAAMQKLTTASSALWHAQKHLERSQAALVVVRTAAPALVAMRTAVEELPREFVATWRVTMPAMSNQLGRVNATRDLTGDEVVALITRATTADAPDVAAAERRVEEAREALTVATAALERQLAAVDEAIARTRSDEAAA